MVSRRPKERILHNVAIVIRDLIDAVTVRCHHNREWKRRDHQREALSHRGARDGSFRSTVENATGPLLPRVKAQAREIARRLRLSQRSFARRLSSEGLTFSEVLEELRIDLAKRHLTDKNLSI